MPQTSETGEAKNGSEPYETDAYGVEIVPFNPDFRTEYDVGPPLFARIPMSGGSGWRSLQVHRLNSNFPANMTMFFKFFRGETPAPTPLEIITHSSYKMSNIAEALGQMSEEAQGLFSYFEARSIRLVEMAGRDLGRVVLRNDLAHSPEFDYHGEPDVLYKDLILARNSSGYAYLAPRLQGVSARFLYT